MSNGLNASHEVIPMRIVAATFLILAIAVAAPAHACGAMAMAANPRSCCAAADAAVADQSSCPCAEIHVCELADRGDAGSLPAPSTSASAKVAIHDFPIILAVALPGTHAVHLAGTPPPNASRVLTTVLRI